ncbi:hypothetical protein AXF42_Ash014652 [Apostasia shenzhenica]|uniref:Transcription repressor n=1 Tax=Apostasia shenzhenica TaxID=1088818 RepID=A0A2I0AKA1_9ASPA|nr:hypothetical protein AXF42_Ash014652 [Apostasia shenzhenica]
MAPIEGKKKRASLFSFTCGCRDSKSVSISASTSDSSEKSPAEAHRAREASSSSGDTPSSASWSLIGRNREHDEGSEGAASFSELLRELSELEQSVMEWGSGRQLPAAKFEEEDEKDRHRKSWSKGRLEESVAVVKETEDPLGDFRRSMLQMIVEKEIVGRPELQELLCRFLSLNSPSHHDLIIRAFAEIWEEVFAGYEDTPELLRSLLPLSSSSP